MFCSQAMNHQYIDVRRRSVDLELAIDCPSSEPASGGSATFVLASSDGGEIGRPAQLVVTRCWCDTCDPTQYLSWEVGYLESDSPW